MIRVGVGASLGTLTNAISAGPQPGVILNTDINGNAIQVGGAVANLINSGLVQVTNAGASALHVVSGGSVGTVTNKATGQITAAGTGGSAILVDGNKSAIGTLSNSGLVQASGTSGTAVDIRVNSSALTISNTAAGTIQSTGPQGVGIAVGGGVQIVGNAGVVQGSSIAVAVAAGGTIGALSNQGTIQTTGTRPCGRI